MHPRKYRIFAKGNNRNRSRRIVKLHLHQTPHSISIATSGHTQEEIEFLKEAERKGLIRNVTWIISNNGSVDETITYAICCLHTEAAKKNGCAIINQYDYAWLKMVLNHGPLPSRFRILKSMSTPAFVHYIQSLGFRDIAGSKTLNKVLATAFWNSTKMEITFRGRPIGIQECKRRNRIAMKFLEILTEI